MMVMVRNNNERFWGEKQTSFILFSRSFVQRREEEEVEIASGPKIRQQKEEG